MRALDLPDWRLVVLNGPRTSSGRSPHPSWLARRLDEASPLSVTATAAFVEAGPSAFHLGDQSGVDVVMKPFMAAFTAVGLGQLDPIALDGIDRADLIVSGHGRSGNLLHRTTLEMAE